LYLPYYIAKRYLISKKSHNIINIISVISVIGVTVGTMALIMVLSVFNGFESLVLSLFNSFNPDIKIEASRGKVINTESFPFEDVGNIEGVARYWEVVEENALARYRESQHVVKVKGVASDYLERSGLRDFTIAGSPVMEKNNVQQAFIGAGVAYYLGVYLGDFNPPMSLYVPSRTSKNLSAIQGNAFNQEIVAVAGVFSLQQEFDRDYVFIPIQTARQLMEYENEVTSVEVVVEKGESLLEIKDRIQVLLGEEYTVKTRFDQQSLLYQVMRSEKWATFVILAFILVIATFNVIGSLSILIIDKKKDIAVLWSLGASKKLIKRIFIAEGMMISVFGGIAGLLAGGLIAYLQQQFGFVPLGSSGDSYIVDAYPVRVEFLDFLLVLLTVITIGAITVWYPVRQISRKILVQRLNFFLMR
jgi:ABC-type lipoprotein release transport system permease subunit